MSHRIKPPHTEKKPVTTIKRDAPVAPAWPSYQGTSQFVGTSPSGRVTIYVDPSLGDPGELIRRYPDTRYASDARQRDAHLPAA